MLGWIIPIAIIAAVIGVYVYRNNRKKADPILDKVDSVAKAVTDDVKKL